MIISASQLATCPFPEVMERIEYWPVLCNFCTLSSLTLHFLSAQVLDSQKLNVII